MNQTFKTNMSAIASAIPAETMKALGATNIKPVSERTIQFDLKTPRPDGTNRVKVTVENGKFLIRGFKIDDTDILYNVSSDAITTALKALGTTTLPPTATIY